MSNKPRNDRFNVDYKHLEKELKSVGITPYIEKFHSTLKEGIEEVADKITKDMMVYAEEFKRGEDVLASLKEKK